MVTISKNGGGNLANPLTKKGFTLIEVIGVIIVLSVIALITVPVVTKVMNDSRKNSFKASAENLVEAANNYYADNQLSMDKTLTFNFALGGKTDTGIKLSYQGASPTGGRLVLNTDGGVSLIDINNGKYYANYDSTGDDKVIVTETNEVLTRDELTQAIKDIRKELLAKDAEIDKLKDANKTKLNANDLLNKTYPVGSIYVSTSSVNPNSIFGGTWVAYGSGRTIVGVDTNQGEFNTVEKTGGEKTHTLSIGEMPRHNHDYYMDVFRSKATAMGYSINPSIQNDAELGWGPEASLKFVSGKRNGTFNIVRAGGSMAHNNLQPYITVYMWKRTV